MMGSRHWGNSSGLQWFKACCSDERLWVLATEESDI